MQLGNNLSVFTGSLFAAAGPAAKNNSKKPAKQLKDVGGADFDKDKKCYNYDIPSPKTYATLTTASNNFSEDKTALLEIQVPSEDWRSDFKFSYKIVYNENNTAYLSATVYYGGGRRSPSTHDYLSNNEKSRILPLFTEIEKLEKDPKRLELIKIMHSGTEQIIPVK